MVSLLLFLVHTPRPRHVTVVAVAVVIIVIVIVVAIVAAAVAVVAVVVVVVVVVAVVVAEVEGRIVVVAPRAAAAAGSRWRRDVLLGLELWRLREALQEVGFQHVSDLDIGLAKRRPVCIRVCFMLFNSLGGRQYKL